MATSFIHLISIHVYFNLTCTTHSCRALSLRCIIFTNHQNLPTSHANCNTFKHSRHPSSSLHHFISSHSSLLSFFHLERAPTKHAIFFCPTRFCFARVWLATLTAPASSPRLAGQEALRCVLPSCWLQASATPASSCASGWPWQLAITAGHAPSARALHTPSFPRPSVVDLSRARCPNL